MENEAIREARIPESALVMARSMNGIIKEIGEAAGIKFGPISLLQALDKEPINIAKPFSWRFEPSTNEYVIRQTA